MSPYIYHQASGTSIASTFGGGGHLSMLQPKKTFGDGGHTNPIHGEETARAFYSNSDAPSPPWPF